MSAPLDAIFQTKYDEFAAALTDVFPEMAEVVKTATDLSAADRVQMYKAMIATPPIAQVWFSPAS